MKSQTDFLLGLLAGAGLMYLLDPERGSYRRSLIRDQFVHAGHELGDNATARARHLRNQAQGAAAEATARMRPEEVDDAVLHERVRSALGRLVSNPGSVLVDTHQGRVTLRGPVLRSEVGRLEQGVRGIRGVQAVESLTTVHDQPGDIPGLQGAAGARTGS